MVCNFFHFVHSYSFTLNPSRKAQDTQTNNWTFFFHCWEPMPLPHKSSPPYTHLAGGSLQRKRSQIAMSMHEKASFTLNIALGTCAVFPSLSWDHEKKPVPNPLCFTFLLSKPPVAKMRWRPKGGTFLSPCVNVPLNTNLIQDWFNFY